MLKERGEAALDYLNFERMLIVISIQINVFSVFSFIVNFCAGERSHHTEYENHYFTPFVNRTSMSNLSEESTWHFYHVIVSFVFPYLVLLTAHLFLPTCLTAGDNPQSRFAKELLLCFTMVHISSTLVVRGLDYKEHTPMVIRNYFQQMHPHVTIRW